MSRADKFKSLSPERQEEILIEMVRLGCKFKDICEATGLTNLEFQAIHSREFFEDFSSR
jgi:hypothetical protein